MARLRSSQVDWDKVQVDYETHDLTNDEICKRYGITPMQLRYRRQQYCWILHHARKTDPQVIARRMFKLVEKAMRKLETSSDGASMEKKVALVAATSKAIGTIQKLSPERRKPAEEHENMADLRDKLAERLDQFKKR